MLQLTRYLYAKEFVELSFYDSMISKRSIKECLFWIYELYYSGLKMEAFDLIYKCYFNFYALLNPSIIEVINKKAQAWKQEKDDLILGTIVKYLYSKKHNLDMFLMYQTIKATLKRRLKKGPAPKWIKEYQPFHREIRAIHDNNDESLLFDVKSMKPDNYEEFLNVVFKYFKNEKKIDNLKHKYLLTDIDMTHPFCMRYILFVIKFLRDFCAKKNKKLLISLNTFELSFISEFKDFTAPLYNVLKTKRMYEISREFINKYKTSINETDVLNETRNNWREHSKETPFWKNKFDSTDEEAMDFDFEFDEQPLKCQKKSCLILL